MLPVQLLCVLGLAVPAHGFGFAARTAPPRMMADVGASKTAFYTEEEAKDSYDESIVKVCASDTIDDMEENEKAIVEFIGAWKSPV